MEWGGQYPASMGGPGAYQYQQHAQQAPYYAGQAVYQQRQAWQPNAYPPQQHGQHDPYYHGHQQQHQPYGHTPAGSAYPQAPAGGFVHPSHAQQYHQQRPQGMQVMPPLPPQPQHHAGQQWAAAGAAAYPAGGSSGGGYSSSGGGQMGLQPHSQPGVASSAQQQQQQYEHPGHRRTQQLVEQQQQQKQQDWQQYHQQQQQEGWQGYARQGPQQGASATHRPTADAAPEPPEQQGQPDSAAAPAPGEGYPDSPSAQQQEVPNRGSVLLAALQNQHGRGATDSAAHAASSSAAAAADAEPMGLAAVQQGAAGGDGSASSSAQAQQAQPPGRVDPRGVYLVGLAPDITPAQLYEVFGAYGRVQNVAILSVKWHKTKCAFVNFETEGGAGPAAVQKLVAQGVMDIGGYAVEVKAKVVKPKAAAAGDAPAHSAQQQQGAVQAGGAGSSKAAQNAFNSSQGSSNSKLLGRNEEGLPMLRGAPCCPYYLGTGECKFRSNCRYHHPRHAMHPECVAAGKKPHRYNAALTPSYARIYNHTERLWDYESCAEAQLKIWLARHLIACENSGCAMFDESAAVPAAEEYDTHPNDAQPLGPYSCTIAEADQVLQLLWKAQPDEASQQVMPYKGRVWHLLADDPYYELMPDPEGYANPNNSWVQLRLANIKGLLNY